MDGIWAVVILAYTVWSIYSGYKLLSGRSEWLDKRAPLNITIKVILSVIVGYFVAAFYLIYLIFRMLGLFSRM